MIESIENVMSKGYPTLNDLENEHIFLDNDLIEKVENLLHDHKCCLIRGAEGRGKTVLARIVAHNKYNEKWKIRFVDISQNKEEDSDFIHRQIKRIDKKKTLFIVENCHASLDKITPNLIDFTTRECKNASFIFVLRKNSPVIKDFIIQNPFEEWEENGWYVDTNPTYNTILGIINKFISINNLNYSLTKQDELWIQNIIESKINQIGVTNLRRLRWYLETWKEKRGNLCEVENDHVLEKILKDIINPYEPERQEMLLKISGVFQYDVDFDGIKYDIKILNDLAQTGIINAMTGYFYRLQHSTDATYIIEAESVLRRNEEIDIVTFDILKEHLKLKPRNCDSILKALYDNNNKIVMEKLFTDDYVYKIISDQILNDRITIILFHIYNLKWIFSKEKALEFWLEYIKLWGNSIEERKEELKCKLNEVNIYGIIFLLSLLDKTDKNEKNWLINDVLDEKNIIEKVKSSSFSAFENLIRLLPSEKMSPIISELNPELLAEKAMKLSRIQSVLWVIRKLEKDSTNRHFTYSFLSAYNKDGNIIHKLKDSDFKVITGFLDEIRRINKNMYEEICVSLSPYCLQILVSSNLSIITRQISYLYRNEQRWKFGNPSESAHSIMKKLASRDLSTQIENLFSKNPNPFKTLGKLLYYSIRIAIKTDRKSVGNIALQIVNNINFKEQKNYTTDEISYLASHVKRCNNLAYRQLCEKIESDIPIDKRRLIIANLINTK